MNKLSHSSVSKFQECPKSWQYHYQNKLRHKYFSSALLFGTAIDKALEAAVQGKASPEEVFLNFWEKQEVNKKLTELNNCPDIVYSDSEIDLDLITKEDRQALTQNFNEIGNDWEKLFETISKKKEAFGFKNLSIDEKSHYNSIAWHILKTKGLLIVEAFKKKIAPKILKVLATQKKIDLVNNDGDVITGYADLVCEWETPGNVVVFDFKTSTKNYEETSVLTSPQLSLYVFDLFQEYKTRKAGYIVFNKKVIKNKTKVCSKCGFCGTGSRARTCDNEIIGERCKGEWLEKISPEIFIQIIIDEIPQQTENIVIENIEDINNQIKNNVFIRNLQSCVRPWGKCSFFSKCYLNSDEDLIKVE